MFMVIADRWRSEEAAALVTVVQPPSGNHYDTLVRQSFAKVSQKCEGVKSLFNKGQWDNNNQSPLMSHVR